MKAFIFDPLWDTLATPDLLEQITSAGLELVVIKKQAPLKNCAALYAGSEPRILCLNPDYVKWKLTSNDYKAIPNLQAILFASTAFSWVDTTYATAHNIPVCNIKNFSTQAVAEWAITMMCTVARQVPQLIKADFPLNFESDFMTYRGQQLQAKTVGIIGLGHIGQAIAERCAGLGMQVTHWSKTATSTAYETVGLADLFANSDVIFPTMAVNEESKKIITAELLRSMKKSATLISVVHNLFDEQLVLSMVENKQLFGFGFEAPPASFGDYEGNVWAAPAYAWVTADSMHNSMVKWVQNMTSAAKGEFPERIN